MVKLHPKVPKYIRIAEEFREQIACGALKPGDRMASFVEMRTKFGVSQAVLERAYLLLEEDHLIVRQSGNGTFVAPRHRAGRRAGQGRRPLHNVLGCVLPPLRLPYYSHLLEGIREVAQRERQQLMVMHDAEPASCERVDGILFHAEGADKWRPSLPAGLPSVTLMGANSGVSVVADDFGGARQATEHLLSLGHLRIGYLVDLSTEVPLMGQRLAGYRSALQDAGIAADPRWVRNLFNYGPMVRRGGFNMYDWMQDGWRELGCTALLVQNDLAAIGAIGHLQHEGIRVPEDISVVGFDSTDECEIVRPHLTSVHVPLREIGAAGTQLLLKMVRGEPAPEGPIVLPTRIDVRNSTSEIRLQD